MIATECMHRLTAALGGAAALVWPGLSARHGQPIGFWRITRYGLAVTAVTLILAWAYVWLRYYAAV